MRRWRMAMLAAFALPVLGGCGFTPLYGTPGVSPGLSAIEVQAPDGRTAYLLRERLDDAFARNRGAPAAYRLDFTLAERRDARGIGPDNAASRYELNVQVDYVLTQLSSGSPVKSGQQKVQIIYDAVDPPYAGIAEQQDSQERAAAEAAKRIRIDLAEYFAKSKG
jgi:LPS-assembly lipoprotein